MKTLRAQAASDRVSRYRALVRSRMADHIIDRSKLQFADVPASLEGEILLSVDVLPDGRVRGWQTITVDRYAELLPDIKTDEQDRTGHRRLLQAKGIAVASLCADVEDPAPSEYDSSS